MGEPGERIHCYGPARGEILGEIAVTADDAVRQTVARARRAQAAWAVLPARERADRLLHLRRAIAARADELVDVVVRECGRPRQEALVHEIAALLDFVGWCARNAEDVLASQAVEARWMKHRRGEVRLVPRGVAAVISSWTSPLAVPIGAAVEALAGGDACVVKPSERSSLVARKAKEIYDATGLPEDLLGVVYGPGATGRALLDAGIDCVLFAGDAEAGRAVAAACGARLVPCALALAGKAPLVAREDCDVERTAWAIAFGGFAGSGQTCVSVERVYAHEAVYPALVRRVHAVTAKLRQGDPSRADVDVGAMVSHARIQVAERHVADALRKGARLVCGGHRLPGPGLFFEPTVLADCDHTMSVMREETLAPIVPMMPVRSDDEAAALVNDAAIGLAAYVFTRDRERARSLADRIDAGSVLVNDVSAGHPMAETLLGGVIRSGYGRIHGADSLRDLCRRKYVSFDRVPPPARDPTWFPYTARRYAWARRAVRWIFAR